MELRPGYSCPKGHKQTEVGVIPEEWEESILEDYCKKITDGTHDTPRPVKTGVPFLTAIHVKDNHIAYDECLFVSKADHEIIFKRCNPEKGDVLMVNIGAGVATTALVEVDYEFSLKNVALLKPDSERISGAYLNYCLAKKKEGITQALLSGGAQPFLSLTQIGQIRIPAPPMVEQRAIAGVLSDVDALIGALDRLIAKKRDLKQAAMQQLLTGRQRLPSFHEKCREVPFKSIYNNIFKKSPISSSEGAKDGAFPLFVSGGEAKRIEMALYSNTEALIFSDGGVFDVRHFVGDFSVTDHCYVVSVRGDMRFYFYWLSLHKSKLDSLTFKGSGLRNLDKTALGNMKVPLPHESEQTAIAAVLSDMDAEIAALETRRDKTRVLKKGMMQELLTGKTRLV